MRLANLYVYSFIYLFLICHAYPLSMANLALQSAGKSWTSSIVSYDLGIHLSPQLRAPDNSLLYIKHYFPQILVKESN